MGSKRVDIKPICFPIMHACFVFHLYIFYKIGKCSCICSCCCIDDNFGFGRGSQLQAAFFQYSKYVSLVSRNIKINSSVLCFLFSLSCFPFRRTYIINNRVILIFLSFIIFQLPWGNNIQCVEEECRLEECATFFTRLLFLLFCFSFFYIFG